MLKLVVEDWDKLQKERGLLLHERFAGSDENKNLLPLLEGFVMLPKKELYKRVLKFSEECPEVIFVLFCNELFKNFRLIEVELSKFVPSLSVLEQSSRNICVVYCACYRFKLFFL